jgi:glycosyltransferase involved in cell wall biosynthesis
MSATGSPLPLGNGNGTPFVSVIMNCHNGARYLREALDSVLAQTFAEWEIVFWDDHSTDESAAIFNSYSDERFRYFPAPERTVLGRARNLAVEQARGEWVAFLDCDDLWLPDKLLMQISIIREEGPELGLVYGRNGSLMEDGGLDTKMGKAIQAYERAWAKRPLPEGNIFPDLLKGNFVPMVSGVVRRSAYWSVGGIDPVFKQAEDYDLFVKISRTFKARAVQESVCIYRVHGSNQSHALEAQAYQEAIAIVGRYLSLPEARLAMRCHQTYLAVYEIRQGRIIPGLKRFLIYGDILFFAHKAATSIWRRVVKMADPGR